MIELARARIRGPDRKLVESGSGSPAGAGGRSWVVEGSAAGPAAAGGSGTRVRGGTPVAWSGAAGTGGAAAPSGVAGKWSVNESRLYMVAPRKA
jgi:hypothetical protein